jgi:hypothetical protein
MMAELALAFIAGLLTLPLVAFILILASDDND